MGSKTTLFSHESAKCHEQMIAVEVGDEDPLQLAQAQGRCQDTVLRPFAAVDQEAVFVVHYHLRGEAAPYRRR